MRSSISAVDGPALVAGRRDHDERWRRRAQPALGTLVQIAVAGLEGAALDRATTRAFARVDDFHRAMSFHARDSDLSAIACAPAGAVITVTPDTWRVLAAAIALETESEGDFDVARAPALVIRGLLPRPEVVVRLQALSLSAAAALQLEDGCRVRLRQPVWVDLGGIAKGAAVDAAMQVLAEHGASAAIVNAGGDIAVRGRDQPIQVRLPWPGQGVVAIGQLSDGAIATSAPASDDQPSPLVAPAGVASAWADRSVSVVAPTCLVADALTKVLTIRGPAAAPLLSRHGARGFAVAVDGRIEHVG